MLLRKFATSRGIFSTFRGCCCTSVGCFNVSKHFVLSRVVVLLLGFFMWDPGKGSKRICMRRKLTDIESRLTECRQSTSIFDMKQCDFTVICDARVDRKEGEENYTKRYNIIMFIVYCNFLSLHSSTIKTYHKTNCL